MTSLQTVNRYFTETRPQEQNIYFLWLSSWPQHGPYRWSRNLNKPFKVRAKIHTLSFLPSTSLSRPKICNRLYRVFTSTRRPAILWQAGLSPTGPPPTYKIRQTGPRSAGGCLFPFHSLWLPLYLSPIVRFFLCDSVSPASLLTDTWPARCNCRTFVGGLDNPTHSVNSLLYVRQSPHSPPFLPPSPSKLIWPVVWLTQSPVALKLDGYAWHQNIEQYKNKWFCCLSTITL